MSRSDGDKPIEGHLEELGYPAARLNDIERRAIALAVVDAYVSGNGCLYLDAEHRIGLRPSSTVRIRPA